MTWAALLAAVGLAIVHLFAGKLRFLHGVPRSRWLSAAGGVSVAYVFVHLLPELSASQRDVEERIGESFGFVENHVYLVALIGLGVFYGLERTVKSSKRKTHAEGQESQTSNGVFWLHMASFSVYNALIGYILLHRERPGWVSLLFFFVAMALHFVVNDFGLREDHKAAYTHTGRWILAAAVLIGWGIGRAVEVSKVALAILLAFLAGGVILNILKEELPEERRSTFWAFALGAAAYAALLLVV